MNPALNREASEARMVDLRRRAERDALALAAKRAVKRESTSISASMIAAILRLLQPRRAVRLPAGADETSPASYTTDEAPVPAPAPAPSPAPSPGRLPGPSPAPGSAAAPGET
jgi:hypothetical protein